MDKKIFSKKLSGCLCLSPLYFFVCFFLLFFFSHTSLMNQYKKAIHHFACFVLSRNSSYREFRDGKVQLNRHGFRRWRRANTIIPGGDESRTNKRQHHAGQETFERNHTTIQTEVNNQNGCNQKKASHWQPNGKSNDKRSDPTVTWRFGSRVHNDRG